MWELGKEVHEILKKHDEPLTKENLIEHYYSLEFVTKLILKDMYTTPSGSNTLALCALNDSADWVQCRIVLKRLILR
jgi:hypothetical protein